ncbi:hypothetical protein [Modestobacter sp. SSW1-42]|uniref:hypothetical protein n=1 Tax=Modestobacter sp. SSW1-42 TaxID=596372 RepID=UPI003985F7CE
MAARPADARAAEEPATRRARRVVVALLLVTLLTQRIAIPFGGDQLPVSLPLVVLLLVAALVSGALEFDPPRLRLYVLAMGAAVACTIVAIATGRSPSVLSLVFLIGIYLIAVVRSPVSPETLADPVHRVFLRFMSWAAAVSLLQFGVQYLGVPYEDYLARLVPEAFLQQGYNTGDPLAYGSPIYRSNAVVFLEPSFLGYFLGVAVVLALGRGVATWRVCLLVAGAIPPLAGNAIAVLVPGLIVLALGQRRAVLRKLVPALVLGLVVAVATPLGSLYIGRSTEITGGDTSANLRLVQPYELLVPVWTASPASVLVGEGAGAATTVIQQATREAVTTPAVPKLLVEYGALGGIPVLLFLGWVLLGDLRGRPWAIGLFFGYLVLNAALLQVTFAIATILLVRLVPGLPPGPVRRLAMRGRPRPAPRSDPLPEPAAP